MIFYINHHLLSNSHHHHFKAVRRNPQDSLPFQSPLYYHLYYHIGTCVILHFASEFLLNLPQHPLTIRPSHYILDWFLQNEHGDRWLFTIFLGHLVLNPLRSQSQADPYLHWTSSYYTCFHLDATCPYLTLYAHTDAYQANFHRTRVSLHDKTLALPQFFGDYSHQLLRKSYSQVWQALLKNLRFKLKYYELNYHLHNLNRVKARLAPNFLASQILHASAHAQQAYSNSCCSIYLCTYAWQIYHSSFALELFDDIQESFCQIKILKFSN